MAIVVESVSSQANTANSTTLIITKPTGTASGDVLLAQVGYGANGPTITAPGGWTLVPGSTQEISGSNRGAKLYYRIADGSEGASFTWTSGTSIGLAGGILRLSGVDTTTPIDNAGAAYAGQANASSTSLTTPSVTTVSTNTLLVCFGVVRSSSATTSWPGTLTERYEVLTSGATFNFSCVCATEPISAAGATGTRVGTITASAESVGQSVALKSIAVVTPVAVPSVGSRDADRLSLLLFDRPGGSVLADWSNRAEVDSWTIGPHGFEKLDWSVALRLLDAYRFYDRPGMPHVELRDGLGQLGWEGRLEDIALVSGGLVCGAFGYASAFSDLPYTGVASDSSVQRWRAAVTDDGAGVATVKNDRYQIDFNNRLYLGLTKNASYSSADPAYIVYVPPAQIVAMTFTYNLTAPTGFRARLYRINAAMSTASALWTVTSAGATLTGTTTITFTADDRLLLELVNTAAPLVYASENGTDYLKLTNIRVKGTTSAAVYSDEIARALVTFINGNGGLSTSTALLQTSPGLDLTDQVYEDANMADILNRLAQLGDSQTPPRVWEWGVLDGQRLYYRPRGAAGRTWTIDAREIEVRRSLSRLQNSVYSVYKTALGERVTTTTTTDAASVARWGLTRRAALRVETTTINQATVQRDMALNDRATLRPDFEIAFDRLQTSDGAVRRFTEVRPGDTIVVKNLPPSSPGGVLDQIRTFRVATVTCRPNDKRRCIVTPETYLPALETLLAQRSVGYSYSKNET